MKQTVEEAAREYWDSWLKSNPNAYKTRIVSLGFAFKAGAEWQAKQLGWISVVERLPTDDSDYIVLLSNGIIGVGIYDNEAEIWRINGIGIVDNVFLYMPIPSFDEILEANRDVLQRMKEKGD